jgi:hypothetical protein
MSSNPEPFGRATTERAAIDITIDTLGRRASQCLSMPRLTVTRLSCLGEAFYAVLAASPLVGIQMVAVAGETSRFMWTGERRTGEMGISVTGGPLKTEPCARMVVTPTSIQKWPLAITTNRVAVYSVALELTPGESIDKVISTVGTLRTWNQRLRLVGTTGKPSLSSRSKRFLSNERTRSIKLAGHVRGISPRWI